MNRAERLQRFASFPERLGEAALAAASSPTPPGEWGPSEVVRHLIAVEREVWWTRFASIQEADEPHWSWTEPGPAVGFEGAGLAEVLEAFTAARTATVRVVRALDEDVWDRHGTHATFGRLDVEGLLRIAADHDEEHLGGLAAS